MKSLKLFAFALVASFTFAACAGETKTEETTETPMETPAESAETPVETPAESTETPAETTTDSTATEATSTEAQN